MSHTVFASLRLSIGRFWLGLRRFAALLGLTALVVGAWVLLLHMLLPAPTSVTVITARTEHVSFTVANPDLAAFRIGGVRLHTEGEPGACFDGFVLPAAGSIVTYLRRTERELLIEIARVEAPAGRLRRRSGGSTPLGPATVLALDGKCGEAGSIRLPIRGPARIGEEPTGITFDGGEEDTPGLLLEGKVQVFGRGVSLSWLPWSRPVLYDAGSLPLAAGSRVVDLTASARAMVPWAGLVTVDHLQSGFALDLTTEAARLGVYLAGGRPEPQEIQVSSLDQLFKDPNLLALQIYTAVVIALLSLLANAATIFDSNAERGPAWDHPDPLSPHRSSSSVSAPQPAPSPSVSTSAGTASPRATSSQARTVAATSPHPGTSLNEAAGSQPPPA